MGSQNMNRTTHGDIEMDGESLGENSENNEEDSENLLKDENEEAMSWCGSFRSCQSRLDSVCSYYSFDDDEDEDNNDNISGLNLVDENEQNLSQDVTIKQDIADNGFNDND